MPGPSSKKARSAEPNSPATIDDQLKVWFDAMLKTPVPPYLLRQVDKLDRSGRG